MPQRKCQPKVYRTDVLACPANAGKRLQVAEFVAAWQRGVQMENRQAWLEWQLTGAFRSTLVKAGEPRPVSAALLRTTYGQMCMAQTRDALRGWVEGLVERVRQRIEHSSLPPDTKHMLHSLNLQNAWGGGIVEDGVDMVAAGSGGALSLLGTDTPPGGLALIAVPRCYGPASARKPIPADVQRLFRHIVKSVLRHTSLPDLRNLHPKIDQRCASLRPAQASETGETGHFDLWLRWSTPTKGQRIELPVVATPRLLERIREAGGIEHVAKTIQILPMATGRTARNARRSRRPGTAPSHGADALTLGNRSAVAADVAPSFRIALFTDCAKAFDQSRADYTRAIADYEAAQARLAAAETRRAAAAADATAANPVIEVSLREPCEPGNAGSVNSPGPDCVPLLRRAVITSLHPPSLGGTMALDLGLVTLFGTNEGDLLGRHWLARLERFDRQIEGLAAYRQKHGLRVRSPRYDCLVQRLRGFVKTEINRVLNTLVARRKPARLVLEALGQGFQHQAKTRKRLSRRLRRLVGLIGKRVIEAKLLDLTQRYGVQVEYRVAAYTSQECSACGYLDKRNRTTQSRFRCRFCGHTLHADVNAPRILAGQRLASVAVSTGASRQHLLHARLAAFMERYPLPASAGSGPATGRPCDPRLDNPYFSDFIPKSEGSTGSAGSSGVTSTGTRVPGSGFAASQQAEPTLKSG